MVKNFFLISNLNLLFYFAASLVEVVATAAFFFPFFQLGLGFLSESGKGPRRQLFEFSVSGMLPFILFGRKIV